jgi:hypothetical protein
MGGAHMKIVIAHISGKTAKPQVDQEYITEDFDEALSYINNSLHQKEDSFILVIGFANTPSIENNISIMSRDADEVLRYMGENYDQLVG